ncbi:hypothetical protein DSL72_007251 [Monilinia vaccinii-corymbosi]|uniref:DNA-binding protein RAP1 n=1 Tax=Monilinia vaccinii-corymbosi TaxID=61207 RepID=A0A8A3PMQ4_9HELO|nr:hypothetical protein DSL72_007251 [Monilinia vaccinii-corymbosi]
MASIVYDGVGGGGTLFQDMRFFILQRVPMRPRWEEIIKSNGGRVEKFEKNAAILIADGARRDTPPGSVSWKFIEESAKAGRLVDIEEYRCRAPVGANGGVKNTRTPFTAADERLLTRWVLEAGRRGRPTKGNQIYMELAAQYPHHTSQSWLDHWRKNLLPRYEAGNLHYETEDGDSPFEREPRPVRGAPAKPPAAQSSHGHVKSGVPKERVSVADSSSSSKQSSSRPSLPAVSQSPSLKVRSEKPIAGRPFTEDDNILLRAAFKEICEIDSDKEIEAWETWTKVYSYHTAQEWRNYFRNEFFPQELSNREKKRQERGKPVLPAASRLSSSPPKDKYTIKTQIATPTKHFTHKGEKSSSKDVVKSPIAPPESKTSEATSSKIGLEKRPYTNDLLKDEVYFKHTLKQFWEPVGDLDFSPKICGKEISLFKLWQIIMLFGGFKKTNAKNRWLEAADKLGFPIANRPEAVEDLNKCYDEVLFDFEISIADAANDKNNPEFSAYRGENLIASQLEEITSHGVLRSSEIEEETGNNDEVLKLPPPLSESKHQSTVSTKKRAISSDEFSSRSGSSETRIKPQSKRRKIEKGKGKEVEIPSTPEHIFNATQPPISRNTSPLKYPLDEGDDASSSDQEARESIRQIQRNKPEGSSRNASVKKPIASPTPAPKKMTAVPVIDLSKDSSPELESESESESESRPQAQLQPPPKSKPRLESKSKSEPLSESPLEPEPGSNSQDSPEDEIDKFKALGYSDEIIVAALDSTTMDYEIASVVMERLKMGHSIPDDMAGVWTKKDDDALILKEGWKGLKRIRAKHGRERITARKEFKGIY